MRHRWFNVLAVLTLLASLLVAAPTQASPPAPDGSARPSRAVDLKPQTGRPAKSVKPIDQPNPKAVQRLRERQRALAAGDLARAGSLALTGSDRVLVILVEFGGTDTFTWDPATSQWDPYGDPDPAELVTDPDTGEPILGDCSAIASKYGLTAPTPFTYSGPLHNEIERPRSAEDRSGDSIWTPDFSKPWFEDFMFGNGVVFSYARQDFSVVQEDFTGKSVRKFYEDMSDSRYTINGDVVGWLQVPHSTWYYDADQCPGARSGTSTRRGGMIPGAGSSDTLVTDALDAVNALVGTGDPRLPAGFDWANYDQDGDGVIDRLWIVHAGYGEEDSPTLIARDRTTYGEAAVWSHSGGVSPFYQIPGTSISAGPYIMMPENGGIGVFAHEYGHNIGAIDLYAYGEGETSAGFWTIMADDWTGYPIGYQPPAADPMHLDQWGWLDPKTISDPDKVYNVKLGQASSFPGGFETYRGVKIELPDGTVPLPVQPIGAYEWWGGKADLINAMMTTVSPISLPANPPATLTFDTAYGIETEWDFLWVQVSADGGATWQTLTNAHTTCTHDPSWIGGLYGFPDDLCGAGLGGFTDYSPSFPSFSPETFDLSAFAGQSVLVRFWYMTDWGFTYEGPYVDNVVVQAGGNVLFSDDAEAGDGKWTYADGWSRTDGQQSFQHAYYLQWRNVGANGGYDSALGESRWRFGPANTGLLVWYYNSYYSDNEVFNYLFDYPGFGPKGRMLVVDAHPEPYRDPAMVAAGYDNEGGNMPHRGQMRDAPFTLAPTVDFEWDGTSFAGRPAVSTFDDRLGYYPGVEYVSRGPGYVPPSYKWVTAQWDASAVVPGQEFYGIRGEGYLATDEFRFGCDALTDIGKLACYWLGPGTGLGYTGGSGNPGDFDAAYGWKVELVEQASDSTWARVRISNSLAPAAPDLAVTSVGNPPAMARAGRLLRVSATTANVGGAATGVATTTRFYLSRDQVRSLGDVRLTGAHAVPALDPQAESSFDGRVVVPRTTAVGNYYVLACADDNRAVSESDETNNCTASATRVLIVRPSGASAEGEDGE